MDQASQLRKIWKKKNDTPASGIEGGRVQQGQWRPDRDEEARTEGDTLD